jgi:hypothetical protein
MEILIECDANDIVNQVDGIFLNYKHATKMLNEDILVSTFSRNNLPNLQRTLINMGNRDVSIKEGTVVLLDKSIWCRQLTVQRNGDDEWINVVSQNLIQKNIITNELDINSIRNSLM